MIGTVITSYVKKSCIREKSVSVLQQRRLAVQEISADSIKVLGGAQDGIVAADPFIPARVVQHDRPVLLHLTQDPLKPRLTVWRPPADVHIGVIECARLRPPRDTLFLVSTWVDRIQLV